MTVSPLQGSGLQNPKVNSLGNKQRTTQRHSADPPESPERIGAAEAWVFDGDPRENGENRGCEGSHLRNPADGVAPVHKYKSRDLTLKKSPTSSTMDHEMRILMRGNEYRVPAAYQDLHGYFELYVSSSGISTMPPLRPADIPDPGPRPSEPVAPVPAARPDEPPRPSTTDEPEVRIRIRNAHRAWEDACDEEDFREHAALRRYEEDLVQFQEWDRRQEEFAQHERNMAAYEEEREAWWAEFRSWDEARKEAEREPRKSPAARKRVLDEDREEGPSVKRAKRGKGKEREKSPDGRTDRFGSHREYPSLF